MLEVIDKFEFLVLNYILDTPVKSATLHFYEILNGVDRIIRIYTDKHGLLYVVCGLLAKSDRINSFYQCASVFTCPPPPPP